MAVTALPNLALNGSLAWRERSQWRATRDLPVLGAFAAVGAVIGTVVLVSVPEEPLIGLLIAVVVAYVVSFFVSPSFSVGPRASRRAAPAVGTVAGFMQGAVGISGPIVASWCHSYRLERRAYILSITVLFSFASVAQFPTLVVGGELSGRWTASVLACVPALLTIPVGARLRNRLSSEHFDRFIVGLLALSAVALAIRTFA